MIKTVQLVLSGRKYDGNAHLEALSVKHVKS